MKEGKYMRFIVGVLLRNGVEQASLVWYDKIDANNISVALALAALAKPKLTYTTAQY